MMRRQMQKTYAELLRELEIGINDRLAQRVAGKLIFETFLLPHDAITRGLRFWAKRMLRLIGKGDDNRLAEETQMEAQSLLWRFFQERDFGDYYRSKIVKFRSWLIKVLRNACLEVLRRS